MVKKWCRRNFANMKNIPEKYVNSKKRMKKKDQELIEHEQSYVTMVALHLHEFVLSVGRSPSTTSRNA